MQLFCCFLTFPLILPNFEPSQHTKSTKKILNFKFFLSGPNIDYSGPTLFTSIFAFLPWMFLPLQEKLRESECFEKILKTR